MQTFNIPGVKENACFMKELHDAENVRSYHHTHTAYVDLDLQMQRRFMDCVETAAFPGQATEEIDRLLHMVCSQVLRVATHSHLFIIGGGWWWSDWRRIEVL